MHTQYRYHHEGLKNTHTKDILSPEYESTALAGLFAGAKFNGFDIEAAISLYTWLEESH